MSDPSLALQAAIFDALRNDTSLAAVAPGQSGHAAVYDNPPPDAKFPYVTVGDGQTIGDDTDCGDGSEVRFQIHVWARGNTGAPVLGAGPQAKQIAGIVRSILRTVTLAVSGFEVVVTEFVSSEFLRDPDGLTRHAVIEFRYLLNHL